MIRYRLHSTNNPLTGLDYRLHASAMEAAANLMADAPIDFWVQIQVVRLASPGGQ